MKPSLNALQICNQSKGGTVKAALGDFIVPRENLQVSVHHTNDQGDISGQSTLTSSAHKQAGSPSQIKRPLMTAP